MNLFELYAKIGVDTNEYERGIKQSRTSFSKFSAFTIAQGQLIADAIKKGGAALIGFGKSAISSYADYEQLEGGIKKLFGEDDMKSVISNSKQAYKTAGMSANKYLETTTSFAASLISGLGGDTKKAAEYADMAIRDMSDNANTFGTDISMIQNTYQGFAKQNYTMLDNLKLGYGGTASEMARLINDSGVLGDTVTVTASNINRVSFDTIIKAIDVTQERMGILGTTTNESGSTISGSISTMQASWENLKLAIVGGTGDIDKSIGEFTESVGVVGENLLPVIERSLSGIVTLIQTLGPTIIAEIPGLIQTLLPEIMSATLSLIGSICDILLNGGVETILSTAFALIMSLLNGLLSALTDGQAFQKLSQLIVDICLMITDPEILVPLLSAALDIITALLNGLIDSAPIIIGAVPELILNLVTALLSKDTLDSLWGAGKSLVKYLFSGFTIVDDAFDAGVDLIKGIWDGITSMGDWLWEQVSGFFTDIFSFKDKSDSSSEKGGWFRNLFNGSHANGLAYVPFDGYVAELHKGERVLTAKEAKAYNAGAGGGTNNISITINGANYSDERSLADAVANALQNVLDRRNAAYA